VAPQTLTLTPPAAVAGDEVTASGTGWTPGAKITLTADFGGGREPIAAAIVADDGSFTAAFTVPDSTSPAAYQIAAGDDAGDVATAVLTITQ
jgi:hypothetical protein